mgnify:CR=1 FL=1
MTNSHNQARQGGEIEITPAMVVAGVKRIRKSLDEAGLGSAEAVVVLEILETALLAAPNGLRDSLTPETKLEILMRARRYL